MSLLLFFPSSGGGGPACTPTEPPTGDALKLETGDHLLLETCDHLLLQPTEVTRVFPGFLHNVTLIRAPQFSIRQGGWLGHVYHTEEPGVRVPQAWLQILNPRRTPELTFLNRPLGWQGHPGLGPFWDATGNIFCGDDVWSSVNISGLCTTSWESTGLAVLCTTAWSDAETSTPNVWRASSVAVESNWSADDDPECPSTRT